VLRLSVRECDLCAAVDFDRFGVLLPYANLPLALPVAERIRARIGEAMAADELAGRVSVSVGLADAATTCGIVDVKAAAEGALYTANARAPRGAIGSAADSVESDGLIRSFPGAVRNAPVTPHAPAPAAAVPAGFVVITADADDEGLDTPHAA
jgi:GGDEF domain-containing protein